MNIAFDVFLRNPGMAGKLSMEEGMLLGALLQMVKERLLPLTAEIDEEESVIEAATIIQHEDGGYKLSFFNYSHPLQKKMVQCFTVEDFRQVQQSTRRRIIEMEN